MDEKNKKTDALLALSEDLSDDVKAVTMKDILENKANIDFIEKSNSDSYMNNSNINLSDTSSDTNSFMESTTTQHIDIRLEDEAVVKFSEDTLRSQKAGKTILKNKLDIPADKPSNTSSDCKDTDVDKGRSIEISTYKNFSSLYDFPCPTKKEKKPKQATRKQDKGLSVHDDCSTKCDILNCPCHRYLSPADMSTFELSTNKNYENASNFNNKHKAIEKVKFDDVNISATYNSTNAHHSKNPKPRYVQALQNNNSELKATKEFLMGNHVNYQPTSFSYTAGSTSEAIPAGILPKYASNVKINDRFREGNNSSGNKLRRPHSLAINHRAPRMKHSKTLDSFSNPYFDEDLYNYTEYGASRESLVHNRFINHHNQEKNYFTKSNYHPRSDYDLKLLAAIRSNNETPNNLEETSETDSDAIYNYDLGRQQSSRSSHHRSHRHHHHKHRNKSHHRKHQCRSESFRTAEEEQKKRSSSCSYKHHRDQQLYLQDDVLVHSRPNQNMFANYSNEHLNRPNRPPYIYQNEPANNQIYLNQLNRENSNSTIKKNFNLPLMNQNQPFAMKHSYTYDQFPSSQYFDPSYNHMVQVQNQLKPPCANSNYLSNLANNSGVDKHQDLITMPNESNKQPYIILRPKGLNPTSEEQCNRILLPRSKSSMSALATPKKSLQQQPQPQRKLETPVPYSTNFSDMVTANASFIDSPIHLLMNHHENQRQLKQKRKELDMKKQLNSQHYTIDEEDPTNGKPRVKANEQKIRFEFDYPNDRMTRNINAHSVVGVSTLLETTARNPSPNIIINNQTEGDEPVIVEEYSLRLKKRKESKFLALLFISLLTVSSIYIFEILSCLLRIDIIHLITYQLSIILTCFVLIAFMSTRFYWKRCSMTANSEGSTRNQQLENENFYNIFHLNTFKTPKKVEDKSYEEDEIKDLMDIANIQQKSSSPADYFKIRTTIFANSRVVRSNIFPISMALILINSWILSNYVYWYFQTKNSLLGKRLLEMFKVMPNWFEVMTSVLGGFGTAVLIKLIIFDLFELNFNLNDLNIGFFVSNETKRQLVHWDVSKLTVLNVIDRQRKSILNIYQKIIFKFFVIIQSHWLMTVGFLIYIFKVLNQGTLNSLLNHVCYRLEMTSKKSHLCFESFISENIIAWKNEIIFRSKHSMNAGGSATKNQTLAIIEKVKSNGDIYLLLTSVACLNFILSCLVVVYLVRSQRLRKDDMNTVVSNSNSLMMRKEHSDFLKIDKTTVYSSANSQSVCSLAMLHSVMPLLFFQGYIKTLLINELIKMYVVCLNGADHLLKLLLSYGCSSIFSIIILALLIIICNLKRSVMFFLIIVQQTTLIVLLFYWDPSRSNDVKTYYIGYIYFICFAICNNLWLTHNLKTLLDKSYELNKCPSVVLFYAYALFCLGTLTGYVTSAYMCTTIKLYLTLILLILFSGVYAILEIVFHFKSKSKC